MSGDIPDWLRGLAPDMDDDDAPIAPPVPLMAEEPEEEAGLDLMADLRSQMDGAEAVIPTAAELARPRPRRQPRPSGGVELGLRPWQQFVLSVLLFLDVTIIGLLFLVMLGRIAFPTL